MDEALRELLTSLQSDARLTYEEFPDDTTIRFQVSPEVMVELQIADSPGILDFHTAVLDARSRRELCSDGDDFFTTTGMTEAEVRAFFISTVTSFVRVLVEHRLRLVTHHRKAWEFWRRKTSYSLEHWGGEGWTRLVPWHVPPVSRPLPKL